ncbi:MAG: hypothetical protein WCB63_03315 [Polyangiales bacterium]
MRLHFALVLGLVVLGGCNLSIPNGLFGCGQPTDCPTGYFCWSSDSRCYDSKEPECAPRTCAQVIADFASLGIPIECGALPDGCEGSIECGGCPPGEACGANGQNFLCGCEENSCANFGGGAECGVVPTRCGGDEQAVFCGACLGAQVCVDNRCVCPPGVNCVEGCGDRCKDEEVCVDGECCEPSYPCADNECSPPSGLPDGCGGVAQCPACGDSEDCVLSEDLVFQCLGDCTCEAQDVECGNATICGSPTLCGSCQDNGFGDGFHCQGGRCVCEDRYELNDSLEKASLLCGAGAGTNCMQDVWGMEVSATLHGSQDVDNYELRVLHAPTPIVAQIPGSWNDRQLYMAYICPKGDDGLGECSGSEEEIQGIKFCFSQGEGIGIERQCDSGPSGGPEGEIGTLLVGVTSNRSQTECDPYELHIFATYQPEIPLGF